jgi:hypothetical protein
MIIRLLILVNINMKSFLNKILIVAVSAFIMPFFSHATTATPTLTCSPVYSSDLVGKTVSITAHIQNGTGTNYDYSWNGDDGIDAGPTLDLNNITHSYTQAGNMVINVTASSTDSSDFLTATCSVNIYTLASLPDYTASCSPSTNRAVIGQTITWLTNISGPLAPYSIVWTGTEGLTSSVFAYATSGSKTAQMVSFQSRYGEETPVHNAILSNIDCSAPIEVITEEIHNPTQLTVSGSCSASSATQYLNSTTTWNSTLEISGGASPYLISWTDNDGSVGTGTSVSKVYSTIGTKSAYLTVQDNAGQEVDLQCGSVSISNAPTSGGRTGGSRNLGCLNRIAGDINCDGNVDLSDFNLLMVNWGSNPTNISADLNNDGIVDILDLNTIMINWIS